MIDTYWFAVTIIQLLSRKGARYAAICKPRQWNFSTGTGIGIGTDTTNAIFSSSIRPMGIKPSRVVI